MSNVFVLNVMTQPPGFALNVMTQHPVFFERYARRLQPAHVVSCIIHGGTANINFVHNNRA